MKETRTVAMMSIGVALLLVGLASEVQAYNAVVEGAGLDTDVRQIVRESPPTGISLRHLSECPKSGEPLLKILTDQPQLFRGITMSGFLRELLPAADGRLELWTW